MSDELLEVTGFLKLEGGPRAGEMLGWKGEWPPPIKIMCATGKESGISALSDSRAVPRSLYLELKETSVITYYERVTYSRLEGDHNELMEHHVARMALYGFTGE